MRTISGALAIVVTEAELRAQPHRWHLRRIEVRGVWHLGFEQSAFAGAWLSPPDDGWAFGRYDVRVTGTWIHPRGDGDGGFGHLGGSPGELRADHIEVIEVIDLAETRTRDGLTGLLIRRALASACTDAGALAHEDIAVALLDIDGFKRINDAHGHLFGDAVLRCCASRLSAALPDTALVARWAGDAFAVVLPGHRLDAATAAITAALSAIRGCATREGVVTPLTATAGVTARQRGETLGESMLRADAARRSAKAAGGDRVLAR